MKFPISNSKYGNKKVEYQGLTFDSKKEYKRWCELRLAERAGEITELRRQVKYVLIPSQREKVWNIEKNCFEVGKVIEREVSYVADFVYKKDGELIVTDTKGFRTPDYIMKRKMMLYFHNIRIKEI